MKPLFVEFVMECGHCRQPLPVNRFADRLWCSHCGQATETALNFWTFFVSPRLNQACNMEPQTDTWAKGMHFHIGSYAMTFGNKNPCCPACEEEWEIADIEKALRRGSNAYQCPGCGSSSGIRKPPQWFMQVLPYARLLLGEAPADKPRSSSEPEHMFCYHCGAKITVGTGQRSISCTTCGKACNVPDEIWQRLNPAALSRPLYVFADLPEGTMLLPFDIGDFIDLAGISDTETALLWDDENGYCVGVVDSLGCFRWVVKDICATGYARLFFVPQSKTIWMLDHDEELVLAFNSDTGQELLNIENEKHDPQIISVLDHYGVAACSDNSLLVYRRWESDIYKPFTIKATGKSRVLTQEDLNMLNQQSGLCSFRRFDQNGRRITLWTGYPDNDHPTEVSAWESLTDRLFQPPDEALIEAAPNGMIYLINPHNAHFARFDSRGRFQGLVRVNQTEVSEILDCAVAHDGSLYILFDHRKKIGNEQWVHIGKISLSGSLSVLVGPHAPIHNYSLGTNGKRIAVAPSGTIHVCSNEFNDLRVLNPDGSSRWKGLWTEQYDQSLAEELSAARNKNVRKKNG